MQDSTLPSDAEMAAKVLPRLILLRHGESMWNRSVLNPERVWRYAGAVDVPLSPAGVEEAVRAGKRIADQWIDYVFTSNLVRASTTAYLALNNHSSGLTPMHCTRDGIVANGKAKVKQFTDKHSQHPDAPVYLPVISTDLLNERSFGELQGVASTEHENRFKKEDLKRYRNDYTTPFPGGESSKQVYERVVPYFESEILPLLREGNSILIVSHGFTIRVLIQYVENMSEDTWNKQMAIEKTHPEQCKLLSPTGIPHVYAFDPSTSTFNELDSGRE